jgi:predicted nucleotidyltransferase component of viral defense system
MDSEWLGNYAFVGGSALAMHLCHRLSEDLDFFTWENRFDRSEILRSCEGFERHEVIHETPEQIDLLLDGVKVSFFNARWEFLRPEKPARLNLAGLDTLAGMKVHALFLRAKFRDYYDLYHLAKRLGVRGLYRTAEGIVPGINYKIFVQALLYIDDIEDDQIRHLEPVESIGKEAIQNFFQERIL